MKYKILVAIIFLVSISFASSAFAADPDVYDKKHSNGYLNMTPYKMWFGSSYLDPARNGNGQAFNGSTSGADILLPGEYAWTQFSMIHSNSNYFANIIRLKFIGRSQKNTVPTNFDIIFYDINNNELYRIADAEKDKDIVVNLNQVFGFAVVNNYTDPNPDNNLYINEIWIDAVLYNYSVLNIDPNNFVLSNLSYFFESPQRVRVSWDALTTNFLKNFDVYVDGTKNSTTTLNQFYLNNPLIGQTYTIEIVPRDLFDREYRQNNVVTFTIPSPDTTPPADPIGLSISPDRYDAVATWQPNTETDLLGYILYLDGNRITNNPSRATTFTITNLAPDTEYELELSAIDTSNNESGKISVTFRTLSLLAPPDAPLNLTGNAFNGGAQLNWLPSRYADEYWIYQDGVKVGDAKGTSFKLSGLVNGTSYDFQVSAVNSVGESLKSNLISLIPDPNKAPPITLGYGLVDLAKGVSDWFASFWGILAFCIAIPLAFYIGNRVKGLMTT